MFGFKLKNWFILLFNLFLLLFIGPTILFDTIHKSHCTISANFYIYLQYFQQKVFSFNKISRSQTDPQFLKIKIKNKKIIIRGASQMRWLYVYGWCCTPHMLEKKINFAWFTVWLVGELCLHPHAIVLGFHEFSILYRSFLSSKPRIFIVIAIHDLPTSWLGLV